MTRTLAQRHLEYCRCCKKIQKTYHSNNDFPKSFVYNGELVFSKKAIGRCSDCNNCKRKKHCKKQKIPVCMAIQYKMVKKLHVTSEMNSSSEEEEEEEKEENRKDNKQDKDDSSKSFLDQTAETNSDEKI